MPFCIVLLVLADGSSGRKSSGRWQNVYPKNKPDDFGPWLLVCSPGNLQLQLQQAEPEAGSHKLSSP